MLLLDAARTFDPLKKLREQIHAHPFVVVGTAAGAGVLLGSSAHTVVALSRLAASMVRVLKPLSGLIGQFAVAKMGMAAGHAHSDATSTASASDI